MCIWISGWNVVAKKINKRIAFCSHSEPNFFEPSIRLKPVTRYSARLNSDFISDVIVLEKMEQSTMKPSALNNGLGIASIDF